MRLYIGPTIFSTLTALFTLVGATYALSQELRPLWYLSQEPLIRPSPGTVYVSTADLIQKRTDIREQASGLVINYLAFEKFGTKEIQILRNALLEEAKFVFVVGQSIPANYVQKKLEIVRKARLLEKTISKWRIVADGLYWDLRGLINGINIMALRDVPLDFILVEVRDSTVRLMERQAPQQDERWEPRNSQTQVFPDPPYGKFSQTVTPNILRGKRDPDDYWYTRLENTAIPGISAYKSKFANKFNSSSFDISSSISLLCHGPTGVIDHNQFAKVSIGCPGPKKEWKWNTGATRVEDKSNVSDRQAQWDVDYDPKGQESKKEYQWIPGLETKNGKNQQFVMGIKSSVTWVDCKQKTVNCFYEWSNPFAADP